MIQFLERTNPWWKAEPTKEPKRFRRWAFDEAIQLLKTQSEPAELGQAYLGRAAAAAEQRHFDEATADYARARVSLRQANDTLALIRVSANEGFNDLELGRPEQALPLLIDATNKFEQWGALNEAITMRIARTMS